MVRNDEYSLGLRTRLVNTETSLSRTAANSELDTVRIDECEKKLEDSYPDFRGLRFVLLLYL